ncbi:MAG: TIGR03905 family TSCPD domain-containing protein [Eubacteriales bacterium]|nr:TIGR03905 family TSCPD domain-containing protein [Eubacteriales bacterium]
MVYTTKGVCAQAIQFELDDDKKLYNVKFIGGCSGNTQGIGKLVEGMDASEVITRLEGVKCGFKNTSCPDQLSKALREALA